MSFDPAMFQLLPEQWKDWQHQLSDCTLCPHTCHANRLAGANGYCKTDAWCNISSICVHRGEEPSISGPQGICNIFFSRCNMQCLYCQNHQISTLQGSYSGVRMGLEEVTREVIKTLDSGCSNVGFVSASHQVVQMKAIIHLLRKQGRTPIFVYNTNGYDRVETLKSLEGLIDVYLPDMKYMNKDLGRQFSAVDNYPAVAMAALREMYRQKGATVQFSGDGLAESGLIVRHLVLPGQVENSLDVLRFISEELSPRVHISLMSQYYPTVRVQKHALLNRRVLPEEYARVVRELENLGMYRGWVQEMESFASYRPDFEQEHPFEH